ncbi:interleukin-20 receptor subunit alpha isoform X2 [Hippopotamus amphibius kiboko]|uniref:interleukin-20 receptor subunit alpha isoform X2 n=1 Tax=Hippopotamus amphibius kiboko TaxID=575201 RepID=UPI00259490A9|nr:interleukin-20 receptor subunit alpha isoform X2 [Hippopotamus amphibius kiboko]
MCAPRPPAKAAARGAPAPDLPALPPLLLLLLLLLVAAPTGRAELLMQLQSVVHGAAVSTVASFWPLGWKTGLSWDAGTAETLPLHMASPYVPCVSGGLPKPTNITFLSINMKNILQWNPPQGLQGVEVTYTVQYFIRYGQKKWLNKSECRNISRTYCDLSAETSDYEHQYYAKVKAIWGTDCSKWAETGRFYPFLETQIGPPDVALTTDEKSISIVLTAPKKWKKNPEESSISMQQIYSNLKYNVSVYNTKSNRTWSQCVTDHTLVFSWLEPDTLYCVLVKSFVPGPSRHSQPSEKQCVSTLKGPGRELLPFSAHTSSAASLHTSPSSRPTRKPGQLYQTSALKVKIIFWYILPISITVCIFSVMGYSMYRYTHVSKEKYPANLILIYGNEFDKRFFVPAEKIVINFITLSILEDSKTSQKDMSVMEKSNDVSDLNEPSEDQEPHWEEMEVKHLGYASHVVDIVCDSEKSIKGTSLTQQEPPSRTMPTDKTVIEYEYDVRTSVISLGPGDQEFNLQEEVSLQGKLFDQQTTLADLGPQTRLYSYTPQLRNLDHLPQGHVDTEEEPEEEPSITLVDWDPQTGRLCLPSLSSFEHSSEGCGHPESERLREEGLLSRLYQDQPPDKAPEKNEAYLMQFMEEWGLYVQMED